MTEPEDSALITLVERTAGIARYLEYGARSNLRKRLAENPEQLAEIVVAQRDPEMGRQYLEHEMATEIFALLIDDWNWIFKEVCRDAASHIAKNPEAKYHLRVAFEQEILAAE